MAIEFYLSPQIAKWLDEHMPDVPTKEESIQWEMKHLHDIKVKLKLKKIYLFFLAIGYWLLAIFFECRSIIYKSRI